MDSSSGNRTLEFARLIKNPVLAEVYQNGIFILALFSLKHISRTTNAANTLK
jgi:hypothetical protein